MRHHPHSIFFHARKLFHGQHGRGFPALPAAALVVGAGATVVAPSPNAAPPNGLHTIAPNDFIYGHHQVDVQRVPDDPPIRLAESIKDLSEQGTAKWNGERITINHKGQELVILQDAYPTLVDHEVQISVDENGSDITFRGLNETIKEDSRTIKNASQVKVDELRMNGPYLTIRATYVDKITNEEMTAILYVSPKPNP